MSGNMKYFKEINSFSDGKPLGHSVNHTFKITDKTVFKLHSGQAPTAYKKPNEFINYYHKVSNVGLGLSITVENGVATEVLIAS